MNLKVIGIALGVAMFTLEAVLAVDNY